MTKIVCTACKGFGKTRSSGKRYHKRENISATAIDCAKCSRGFVATKIAAATLAKQAPAKAPRKVASTVLDVPELAWIEIMGQEFAVQAPKSARKAMQGTRKA